MANLKDVIDVSISVQNTSVVSENFNLILLMGSSNVFSDLFRVYEDTSAMIDDGFSITSPEYVAASRIFEQAVSVPQIYVGRRASDTLVATVNTAVDNTAYFSKVDDVVYNYTSGQAPTNAVIAAGLVAALASDTVVNATDNHDGTYGVSSKVGGTNWDVTLDADQDYTFGIATNTIADVHDNTDYTATINGTLYTYNSGVGATDDSIAAGLVALIAVNTSVDVTDNLDGTYKIAGKIATPYFTIAVDANQTTQVESIKVSISTVAESHTYSTQINLVAHTYISSMAATVENIAAGLVAAMSSDPIVNVTDNLDGTYTVTNKVTGTTYAFNCDSRQSYVITLSQSIINDIVAIQNQDNTWYGLIDTGHLKADALLIAEWAESNKKLFGTVTNDPNIINETSSSDTTSIPALFRAANYHYSWSIYNATTSDFADAAWMGYGFAQVPGAITWALKTLIGITADVLTETQSFNALSKQCNTYETIAGDGVTRQGTVADNQYVYIDVVRDLDWLQAAIQTTLFQALVSVGKVPYTDGGISVLKGYLQQELEIAVNMGILSSSPNPVVTAPLARNVPLVDKENRILHNLNFTAELAGAIQKAVIQGTVQF